MSDRQRSDDVERYAAAVRAAMTHASTEERADLLDDLESHLSEVAAESGAPLVESLGSPEDYAAELRAAYEAGARPEPQSRRAPPRPFVALQRGARSRRWCAASLAVLLVAAIGLFAGWQVITRHAKGVPWSYAQLRSSARAGQVRGVVITATDVVAIDRTGGQHAVVDAPRNGGLAAALAESNVDVTYQTGSAMAGWLAVVLPNLVLLGLIVGLGVLLYVAVRRRGGRLRRGLPPS